MTDQPQTLCRTCASPIGYVDCPTGGWWAHETHPADEHDAVPGAWVDGDDLMETIAAEVWEHCASEGTSLVVDDPRNIAGTAAAVARRMLAPARPAVPVSSPPPDQTADRAADRAAVLREAAHDLATAFGDPKVKHIGAIAASHLRRRARELEGRETDEEQPETPLEKRLRYSERRNDELRTECKRRGKRVLEQSEKIIALEKQLDEVRTQLGAEILRAGQAEAELRRLAAEAPQPETPNTDRAAVYREVADRLTTDAHGMQPDWARIYKRDAAVKVREWADRLDGEGAPTKKLPAS